MNIPWHLTIHRQIPAQPSLKYPYYNTIRTTQRNLINQGIQKRTYHTLHFVAKSQQAFATKACRFPCVASPYIGRHLRATVHEVCGTEYFEGNWYFFLKGGTEQVWPYPYTSRWGLCKNREDKFTARLHWSSMYDSCICTLLPMYVLCVLYKQLDEKDVAGRWVTAIGTRHIVGCTSVRSSAGEIPKRFPSISVNKCEPWMYRI